jgi:hypothetical protein
MAGFYVHGDEPLGFLKVGKLLTNYITTAAQGRSCTRHFLLLVKFDMSFKERKFGRLGVGL